MLLIEFWYSFNRIINKIILIILIFFIADSLFNNMYSICFDDNYKMTYGKSLLDFLFLRLSFLALVFKSIALINFRVRGISWQSMVWK